MRILLSLALVAGPALMAGEGHDEGGRIARGSHCTATANAHVNIMAPVCIESTQDMDFGTVLMDQFGKGGHVTMFPKSGEGDADLKYDDCAAWGGAHVKPALFNYRRDSRYPVTISIDDKVDMKDGVKLYPSLNTSNEDRGEFCSKQELVEVRKIAVGGTLNIDDDAKYGEHNGRINVTVAYK